MASITSTATGNWATGATWVGGVAPGNGDTAILANGHTVTIAASTTVTVGDSANPTTPAISSTNNNGTGILNVSAGATLTVKGNVRQGNANWTLTGPCAYYFEHATANLTHQITDDGGTVTNAKLMFAGGTGASRITVAATGAAAGGGFGNVTGTKWNGGGKIQATGVQFTNIGTASLPFLDFRPALSSYVAIFDDCLFTSCGKIESSHVATAGMTFRLRRTTIRTPVSSDNYVVKLLLGSGTHTNVIFQRVRWDGILYYSGLGAVLPTGAMTDCAGQSYGSSTGWPLDASSSPPSVAVDLLLLHNRIGPPGGAPSVLPNGTLTRLYSNRQGQGTSGNGHAAQISLKVATSIDGAVWDCGEQDSTGDGLQLVGGSPASPTTLSLTHMISPPAPGVGGQACGAMFNVSAATGTVTNARITYEQNTGYVDEAGDSGGSIKTEAGTVGAGVFVSVRDNIWYRRVSGNAWGIYVQGATLPVDGTFTNVDYNCKFNLSTDGYQPGDAKFTSPSPPGTHDITTNPAFVDDTRNMLTWGQTLNGSLTTRQQVFDEIMKRNDDTGFTAGFEIQALYDWVQAGFAPTDAAFDTAGHAGGQVGAMAAAIDVGSVFLGQFGTSAGSVFLGASQGNTAGLSVFVDARRAT